MPARRPTKSATPATNAKDPKPAKSAKPRTRAKVVKPTTPSSPPAAATTSPVAPATPAPASVRRRSRRASAAATTSQAAPSTRPARAARRSRRTRRRSASARTPAASSPLAQALAAQMAARGLSLAAAARAIGVNPVGLRRTLSKNSTPNARTAQRYQRWLRSVAPEAASTAPAAAARSRVEGGSAVLSPSALRMTLGDLLRAAAGPAEPQIAKADRAFLGDDLARRVHAAPAAIRRLVGTMLATLRA